MVNRYAASTRNRMMFGLLLLCFSLAQTFVAAQTAKPPKIATQNNKRQKKTVLTLTFQPLFKEQISLQDASHLAVKASFLDDKRETIFDYVIEMLDPFGEIAKSFSISAKKFSGREPNQSWNGSWYKFEQENQPAIVARDHQIESSEQIRQALLKLDINAGLTINSVKNWLKLSDEKMQQKNFDKAFAFAKAALERVRLPHIKILAKDDISLKILEAQATFDAGQKKQAVEIIMQLAEERLAKLTEKKK